MTVSPDLADIYSVTQSGDPDCILIDSVSTGLKVGVLETVQTATYAPQSMIDADAPSRRDKLVIDHLPQVRIIAGRIHERLSGRIALEDLISSGVVGLLFAVDNFDPSFKVQLKTYAESRINGAIIDSLREMDWVPREIRKRSKLIQRAIRTLQQKLGREPDQEEIAEELCLSLPEYQQRLSESQTVEIQRLEFSGGDDQSRDLLNIISDDEESWPSRIIERSELERVLTQAIDRMPKQERTVLSLYYFEELTLREIGEVMGMHLSRCGQLRVQGILRLRSHMERVWASKRKGR
jgi:RNA polymerase sigma factor for flagellar operon FliA